MTAVELLENLNLLDEHERIEAKRASEAGKSLLETICAFANEPSLTGGWIVLGVVREEMALLPAYEVEGIAQPDKITAEIATQCRDIFNIPLRVDISTENIQGKNVVVVFVPEAQAHEKPVFFKAQGLPRGAFRRIGSTDQRCTDDDLAVFYQGRQQESFDAGIVADAQLKNMTEEQFDRVIDINLKGVYNCTKAVVDKMLEQKSGVILNSSSIVGLHGNFGQTNYAAAKFGVIGMAKTWARELGRKGIRSNAVCPGFISTPIISTVPEKVINALEERVPMGRLGKPEEIANTFAFLASDEASYINGAVIEVSGGLTI